MALHGCDNEDQLQKAVTKIASEFAQEIEKQTLRLRDQLVLFIETNKLKEIMIQWKQTKLNRLKSHAEDLNNKSRTEINNLKEELRIERIRIHEKIKHENEINELARKLWQIMKDIGSEHISVRKMVNDSQQETDIYLYKKQAIDVSNNIFMKIDIKLNELVCQDIRFDISYVNEILNIIFNDVQNHNEHTLNEYKFNLPTTYRAMIIIMLFSM